MVLMIEKVISLLAFAFNEILNDGRLTDALLVWAWKRTFLEVWLAVMRKVAVVRRFSSGPPVNYSWPGHGVEKLR